MLLEGLDKTEKDTILSVKWTLTTLIMNNLASPLTL